MDEAAVVFRPRSPDAWSGSATRSPSLLTDFAAVFGELPVATALLGTDGRLVRVNTALCRLLGRAEGALLGQDLVQLTLEDDRDQLADTLADLLAGRVQSTQTVERRVRPDGTVLQVLVSRTAVPDGDGRVGHLLQQSVEQPVETGGGPPAVLRSAQALLQVYEDLADRGHDRPRLAEVALEGLTRTVGGAGTVWLVDADGVSLEAVAVKGEQEQAQAELVRLYSLVQQRLDRGYPAAMSAAPEGYLLVHDPFGGAGDAPPPMPEFLPWLRENPVTALLFVPLEHGGRLLGVLALGRHVPGGTYDAPTVAWTRQVARRLAIALAEVSLRELERTSARRERVLSSLARSVDEALHRPDRVLADVTATVAAELGAPCALRLLGPTAVHLGVHASAGGDAVVLDHLEQAVGPDGELLRRVRDAGTGYLLHAPESGLPAVYGVLLTARGAPLGVLVVGRVGEPFTVEERRLVDAVAERLSLAFDNAALLAETQASQRRHRAIVQHSSDLLLLVDGEARIAYASPSVAGLVSAGVGDALFDQVVPDDRPRAEQAWSEVVALPGVHPPSDIRITADDGAVHVLQVVANNLLHDPAVAGVVLTVRDVTGERESSKWLQQQADQQAVLAGIGSRALTATTLDELFVHAVHAVNDVLRLGNTGLLELEPGGDLLIRAGTLDPAAIGSRRIPGSTPRIAELIADREPVVVRDYLAGLDEQQRQAARYGVRSGVLLPVLVDGRTWGVLSCHTTELHEFSSTELDFLQTACTVLAGAVQRSIVEGRVLHQATHDALTGLPNRVTLHAALERSLSTPYPTTALLLLDLNDFKDVNDSLGHAAGDRVLGQLGGRLCSVVGHRGTVARLGGDEFAVCLDATDGPAGAVAVAADVLRALDEPFHLPGLDLTLSGSVGVAVAPEHGLEPGRLLQHADLAMYRAKATRSGCAVFDASLDRERSERLSLLVDLREAVGLPGGLVLHYQPLVDLRSGQVCEVEALVRWQHPERGLMAPDLFVSLAEQTDLIDDLTLEVARVSAERAAVWHGRGFDVPVACNVSPVALHDPNVVEQLVEILSAAAGLVTVEITESALVDERARTAIRTLAGAGVRCAVDDFGTGYSALSYLRDLPVDRLKLDRAFNVRVDRDDRDATLVAGVVRMAHDLGLHVVAEGVETPDVAGVLRQLGVDLAQGWLYGRPQPAEALSTVDWRLLPGRG